MTFVFASTQTSGHGRFNREWDSGNGTNLLCSILFKNRKIVKNFDSVSLLFPVIILELLESCGIQNVMIKWPNDVYVRNKKICGILLEGQMPNYLIVGVGLNVNENNLKYTTSTSIFNILSTEIPLSDIKEKFIKITKRHVINFIKDKDSYFDTYISHNYLLDKDIKFEFQNSTKFGKVIGISKNNELIVNCDNEIVNLSYGEVTLHR